MNRQIYPTIKDFKNMGLSDYQITRLIELENNKHYFRQQFKNTTHYSEPNSIFFLDIKDTLYHSSGHGNSGVLGRAGDSLQIFMRDVLALGSLLEKSTGQNLTMNLYSLCEDNSIKIEYNFPTDVQNAKYKMDIPFKQINDTFTNRVINQSNVGPYKTVFVSADSVETQKKIILFLLLVYKIYLNGSFRVYRGESASCIDSQEILKLEKLFEICNCDYDKFIANLPQEHSNVFDHYTKIKIEKIMNNIIFLSTKDSNLTKVELVKTFLADYNIKNGLSYEDYNIFACGDDYNQDGPMIKLALQLGGYGCINNGGFNYFSYGETIRNELWKNAGIEINIPIVSYGFSDFYNKALDVNSLQRTWDLAETMQDINKKDKNLNLNRFKKTNHYIRIK